MIRWQTLMSLWQPSIGSATLRHSTQRCYQRTTFVERYVVRHDTTHETSIRSRAKCRCEIVGRRRHSLRRRFARRFDRTRRRRRRRSRRRCARHSSIVAHLQLNESRKHVDFEYERQTTTTAVSIGADSTKDVRVARAEVVAAAQR
jgi:hypothetical protein